MVNVCKNDLFKRAGTQNRGLYPYIFFSDLQSTPIKVPYTKIWLKTNERFSDDQKTLNLSQFWLKFYKGSFIYQEADFATHICGTSP